MYASTPPAAIIARAMAAFLTALAATPAAAFARVVRAFLALVEVRGGRRARARGSRRGRGDGRRPPGRAERASEAAQGLVCRGDFRNFVHRAARRESLGLALPAASFGAARTVPSRRRPGDPLGAVR